MTSGFEINIEEEGAKKKKKKKKRTQKKGKGLLTSLLGIPQNKTWNSIPGIGQII